MSQPIQSVLIIGAGIAGLAAAKALAEAGLSVTILDKGRQPGGRIAARQVEGITFNHGAQFATATGIDFSLLIAALTAQGHSAAWPAAGGDRRRLTFAPDMTALPKRLADAAISAGAILTQGDQAVNLLRADDGWRARHLPTSDTVPGAISQHGGTLTDAHDAVILAIPAAQAAPLLAPHAPTLSAMAETAVFAPCWAVGARFPEPIDLPDVWQADDGAVAWAARETTRPLQSQSGAGSHEAWTLHANADWSRQHIDAGREAIGIAMLHDFSRRAGVPSGTLVFAHRWRFARVEKPVGASHLWDTRARIGACGDWCIGPRIEAAFDSGLSLARSVLDRT